MPTVAKSLDGKKRHWVSKGIQRFQANPWGSSAKRLGKFDVTGAYGVAMISRH